MLAQASLSNAKSSHNNNVPSIEWNGFLFFLVISYVAFQARPSQPQNPGSICKWGVVRITLPRPQASRQGSKLTTVSTSPRPRGFGGSRPRPRQPCSRDNRGSSYKQSQRWKYLAPHRVSYALVLFAGIPKEMFGGRTTSPTLGLTNNQSNVC